MSVEKIPCLVLDQLLEQWTRAFYRKTRNQPYFSSDLMRAMGLDSYLIDPRHHVGMYCTTILWRGWITETARTRSVIDSNHGREIRIFKWTERAHKELD